MIDDFDENGYIIVRKLFSESETNKMVTALENCPELWQSRVVLPDLRMDKKKTLDLYYWTTPPGDDVLDLTLRNQKTAGVSEKLLNRGEIYLYGNNLYCKYKDSAAVEWHQDYGYCYRHSMIFPDFITCGVALTKNDRENGGIKVLKGSVKCSRVDHDTKGGILAADPERVKMALGKFETVYCDMRPGDATYWHGNCFHASESNLTDMRRWTLSINFNAKSNSPEYEPGQDKYYPVFKQKMEYAAVDSVEKCQKLKLDPKDFDAGIRAPHDGQVPEHEARPQEI